MSYNQDTTNSYRIQGRINKFWAYILSGKIWKYIIIVEWNSIRKYYSENQCFGLL
jgi:hypothetical protein